MSLGRHNEEQLCFLIQAVARQMGAKALERFMTGAIQLILVFFVVFVFPAQALATPEFTYMVSNATLHVEANNRVYKTYRCTFSFAYSCGKAGDSNSKALSGSFFVFPFNYNATVLDYPIPCANPQYQDKPSINCD